MFSFIKSIFVSITYIGAVLLSNVGLVSVPVLPAEKPATAVLVHQVSGIKVITADEIGKEEVKIVKKEAPILPRPIIQISKQPEIINEPKQLTNKEIIAKVRPAVVYIKATTNEGFSFGTGMIIDKDGFVLTNAHVVEGSRFVDVKLPDGRVFGGTVVGWNYLNTDLAVIQLGSSGISLPTVELGNSVMMQQGDAVFTFGYPFGSILDGDVSFKEGTLSRRYIDNGKEYLEMSAEIHPGNSGGPLVDSNGRVVGVNTLGISTQTLAGKIIGETVKWAIPIDYAKVFIPNLRLGMGIPAGFLGWPVQQIAGGAAPSNPTPASASSTSFILPPIGSEVTIKRQIAVAVIWNPELQCEQLGFFNNDLNLCKLYKERQQDYKWNIVD